MSASNPISPKVISAAAGAGGSAIIGGAILWALGAGVFGAGWEADTVEAAIASVPSPLAALVYLLITVAGAAIPGYFIADPNRVVGPARAMSPTPQAGEYRTGATEADYAPIQNPDDEDYSPELDGK